MAARLAAYASERTSTWERSTGTKLTLASTSPSLQALGLLSRPPGRQTTREDGGMTLDDWTAALAAELGLDPLDLDVRLLLDVARDAAHHVDRPAAPLTTFLVGYAAALRGGGAEAVRDAAAAASRLALSWPQDQPQPPDIAE